MDLDQITKKANRAMEVKKLMRSTWPSMSEDDVDLIILSAVFADGLTEGRKFQHPPATRKEIEAIADMYAYVGGETIGPDTKTTKTYTMSLDHMVKFYNTLIPEKE